MNNDPGLKNEYHVWFGIHDFECLPDELTKQLGMKPTRTKIKGEYRIIGKKKSQKMLNKENQWILDSELHRNVTIEKHLKHLVNKIKPHKQKFIEITKKYYAEFGCATYYYEANPGIHLDNDLLKEISELNARIDLDIYCLTGTVLQLEDLKAEIDLTKQLSKVKFISQFGDEKHNEVQTLVDSLKGLEDVCYNFLRFHLPDLFWNELSDKEYRMRLTKIVDDLRKIEQNIKQSRYFKSCLSKPKKND